VAWPIVGGGYGGGGPGIGAESCAGVMRCACCCGDVDCDGFAVAVWRGVLLA